MQSLLPSYTHIVNRRLKNTYLTFDDEGGLVIKSPEISQNDIERLLIKKAAWIAKAQKQIKAKKGKLPGYEPEAQFYFIGICFPLHFVVSDKTGMEMGTGADHFIMYGKAFTDAMVRTQIEAFYRKEVASYMSHSVPAWAQKMEVAYGNIKYRKAKRQWGSCSAKNDLSFNPMLMKLPPEVIEYVIVHELAHIRHKHHQKAFWNFVEAHMPNYREYEAILKTYTPS